jgi:hypothetical protein
MQSEFDSFMETEFGDYADYSSVEKAEVLFIGRKAWDAALVAVAKVRCGWCNSGYKLTCDGQGRFWHPNPEPNYKPAAYCTAQVENRLREEKGSCG